MPLEKPEVNDEVEVTHANFHIGEMNDLAEISLVSHECGGVMPVLSQAPDGVPSAECAIRRIRAISGDSISAKAS